MRLLRIIKNLAFLRATLALLAALALWPPAARAEDKPARPQEPDPAWIVTLQFSNDMFGGSDAHFTHGPFFAPLAYSWVSFARRKVQSARKPLPGLRFRGSSTRL